MPEIKMKDFSAGWIPSDDSFGGRKNGLLKMTGVTLDENGILSLSQGSNKGAVTYPAVAHSLFYKLICSERRAYVGLKNGAVYRNATELIAAGEGSTARAAFGVFGDYVLIFSGDKRIKDSCTALNTGDVGLGLTAPDDSMIVNKFEAVQNSTPLGTLSSASMLNGSTVYNAAKDAFLSTQGVAVVYTGINNFSTSDFPKDLAGSSEDVFTFNLKCQTAGLAGKIRRIDMYFVMSKVDDGAGGFITPDYYSHAWLADEIDGAAVYDTATLSAKRADFERGGVDNVDWSSVIGIAYTIALEIGTATIEASNFAFGQQSVGESGNLNGIYTWLSVNVLKQGAYEAASDPGPATPEIQVINGSVEIIPQDPTIIEPNTTEIWIYRRGGLLPEYYRVGVVAYDTLGPFYDNLSDLDALKLGRILNTNTLSITSQDLPEAIIEIVGPVFNRMVYFSKTSIYFGEPNSPETYDPRNTLSISGDESEKFQFARKVSENVILYGTTRDVYKLTGTFIRFPDGALDVYIRPLGTNKPPMSRFASVYNGALAYFASQDWILLSPDGSYQTLTSPNTDQLYLGKQRYSYGGVPTFLDDPDLSYSCVVAKNKLWCIVPIITDYTSDATIHNITTWGYRMEVFDFVRKYWRPASEIPYLLATSDDEAIYGFMKDTLVVNELDSPFTKLLNKV